MRRSRSFRRVSQYPDNDLDKDDLDLVHDSSLIYLYRLIFVLYAGS